MDVPDEALDQFRRRPSHAEQATVADTGPLETNLAPPIREIGPGANIGRYIVLHELGRGGMGIVFAAFDPQLDRKVALKLLHRRFAGSTDTHGVPHILREAQALAKLSHPNVVQVYDAGTHEGRVFMAMEYVDGMTMRRWSQAETRSFHERLGVCIAAGRGLQAAHAGGIVHRDFKPDNVLIGADGRVLVLDFGLAEARAQGVLTPLSEPQALRQKDRARNPASHDDSASEGLASASGSSREVGSASLGGTPVYMAPELRDGATPGAVSDLFAFCVTLHEAIYTIRPFKGRDAETLYGAAKAANFEPLPGNLDAPMWVRKVVERGVAFDPQARWPSMESLLLALERGREARRRRAYVALGIGVVGAAALAWGLTRPEPTDGMCNTGASEIAVAWNEQRANAVAQAFGRSTRVFASESAARASTAMGAYAHRWSKMRDDTCAATRIHDVQSEAVLALRMACLDRGREELSSLASLLESGDDRTVQHAVEAVVGLSDVQGCADIKALASSQPLPDDPAQRTAVTQLRQRIAKAHAEASAGRVDLAGSELAAIVTAGEGLAFPPLLSEAYLAQGQVHEMAGDRAASRVALLKAVFAAERGGDTLAEAQAYVALVRLVRESPQFLDEADEWVQHAEALAARHPDAKRVAADLRFAKAELAYRHENFQAYYQQHKEALDMREAQLGARHPDVFASLRAVGSALTATGEYAASLPYFRRSLSLSRELYGETHPKVAAAYSALALGQDWLGDRDAARGNYTRAIDMWTESLGPMHPDIAAPLNNIAGIEYAQGDYPAALEHFTRTLQIYEGAYGSDHADVALALGNLGLVHDAMGQHDSALSNHQRALEIRTRVFGPEHLDTAVSLYNIGDHYSSRGELDRAQEFLQRALEIYLDKLGPQHPDLGELHASFGRLHAERGDWAKAEAEHRRAFALWSKGFGEDHPVMAAAHSELGQVALARGRLAEARDELSAALRAFEASEATPTEMAPSWFAMARAQANEGKPSPAAIEFASKARAAYLAQGQGATRERVEVEAWLRAAGVDLAP